MTRNNVRCGICNSVLSTLTFFNSLDTFWFENRIVFGWRLLKEERHRESKAIVNDMTMTLLRMYFKYQTMKEKSLQHKFGQIVAKNNPRKIGKETLFFVSKFNYGRKTQ